MIYDAIKGEINFLCKDYLSIETGNICYRILIPMNVYTELLGKTSQIKMFISEVIREDTHRLFGFTTRQQRDFFEKLSDVSGMGPKTALAIIGHMDAIDLRGAVQLGDSISLTKIPGIGKKTAERLLLELKGKNFDWPDSSPNIVMHSSSTPMVEDAIAALIHLGYSSTVAYKTVNKAVSSFQNEYDLSDLITYSLKII